MTDNQLISWLQTQDSIKLILVEVRDVLVNGVPTNYYFSNRTFISSPTDSPANTIYDPAVSGGVRFTESLGLDGSASVGFGEVELTNSDGSRDSLLKHIWVNRPVNIYIGDPRFLKADFRLIFSGHVENLYSRNQDSLNITILDKLAKLSVPITDKVISNATNGELVPLTFGECFNVPAVLSDPPNLEYTVHDAAIEDIIEVRDNGYPVEILKNLDNGKFKLKNAPYGKITASVQGSKTPTYTNNIAELISRVITSYGPESSRLTSDIDSSNFLSFSTANPQPVGIFIDKESTKLQVCQELAKSVGATITCNSQGKLQLIRLTLPAVGTPLNVYPTDMLDDTLIISDKPTVKASVKLNYCINWSTQEDNLAAGINPDNLDVFKLKWYKNESKNLSVANDYDIADTDFSQDTLLLTQLDADNESDRRLDMWSTQRQIYQAEYFSHLILIELGQSLRITHDRFGLEGGKIGTVTYIERDWFNSTITIGVLA